MTQRLSSRVFAGRARELGELVAAMEEAAEGVPIVVLVGGEAGIGKSIIGAMRSAGAPGCDASWLTLPPRPQPSGSSCRD